MKNKQEENLLVKDENLLETANSVPASYEQYDIKMPNDLFERDDEVLQKFYEQKLSNAQAQFIYDLANERVVPCIMELAQNFEAKNQKAKLINYFGGEEKFGLVSSQISGWAKQNMSPDAYEALATTAEGVIALYKMMSSQEPVLAQKGEQLEPLTEEKLKKMMQDTRYWRDNDQAYIAKVTKGFERLYPNNK